MINKISSNIDRVSAPIKSEGPIDQPNNSTLKLAVKKRKSQADGLKKLTKRFET